MLAYVAGGSRSARFQQRGGARRHVCKPAPCGELVIFILNGVIFILIGLQLGALRDAVCPPGSMVPFCWPVMVERNGDRRAISLGAPGGALSLDG